MHTFLSKTPPLRNYISKKKSLLNITEIANELPKLLLTNNVQNKINKLNESGKFTSKIVTEIEAISDFYNAEDYHQDYYKKRGIDGCAI
mgnify:CR=1 FL=1